MFNYHIFKCQPSFSIWTKLIWKKQKKKKKTLIDYENKIMKNKKKNLTNKSDHTWRKLRLPRRISTHRITINPSIITFFLLVKWVHNKHLYSTFQKMHRAQGAFNQANMNRNFALIFKHYKPIWIMTCGTNTNLSRAIILIRIFS